MTKKNWTFWTRLYELKPFFHTQKKGREEFNFFWNVTQRIEPFLMTQRIDFFLNYDSQNWTFLFFKIWQRSEPSCYMTRRIEPSFFHDSKELNFLECDSRNWTFSLNMTQRIEPFVFSKDWTLLEYDSKNWTFFQKTLTLRIEPF